MSKYKILSCPYCGRKQKIEKTVQGVFPIQECKSLGHSFYVNPDLTIRKLTEQESKMLKKAWVNFAKTCPALIKEKG